MKVDGGGKRLNTGKPPMRLLPLSFYQANAHLHAASTSAIAHVQYMLADWFYGDGNITYLYDILEKIDELVCRVQGTDIAKILQKGAEKYEERNWERGMNWSICYECAQRHLEEAAAGMREGDGDIYAILDKESGLPSIFHAICNIMFLIEYSTSCPNLDDRPRRNNEEA